MLYFVLFLLSCKEKYIEEKNFIDRANGYRFEIFKNLEIKLRGKTSDNLTLVSVLEKKADGSEEYNTYSAYINREIKCYPVEQTECLISLERKKIIMKFIDLEISYIKVDMDGNAQVNVHDFEKYSFVKVIDSIKYFSSRDKEKFELIGLNWYAVKK